MKSLQTLIGIILISVFVGCERNTNMAYSEAKKVFVVGMTEDEIKELYGEPSDIMEYPELRTLYYDHTDIIESLESGDRFVSFKVNFRDGVSESIQEIIITKRRVYP
ncbi:MAG: hypothetical protein ACSHYA_14485 [Opitutaceae bacterium]